MPDPLPRRIRIGYGTGDAFLDRLQRPVRG
jgi:hypothetical protein